MTDFTFNPKILEKIDELDMDDEYKEFLREVVEWEKDKDKDDLKFSSEYDRKIQAIYDVIGEE